MMRELLRQAIKNPNGGEGTGPLVHGRMMPYVDCCGRQLAFCRCTKRGKLTIGYGRNIEDRGITLNEGDALLERDLDDTIRDLLIAFPWVEAIGEVRQAVLVEMLYNLGMTRFKGFAKMLRAAREGDYELAAIEMLDSEWAEQVGRRALRLADSMRTGVWQTL